MAYIEALRQRLLGRVEGLCRRMAEILVSRRRMAASPSDTLAQVHRLAMLAYKQLHDRFDDVDAQTGEFSSLMRNVDNQRRFIRTNRDWLYRNQRIWDSLLSQWEQVGRRGRGHRFAAGQDLPVPGASLHADQAVANPEARTGPAPRVGSMAPGRRWPGDPDPARRPLGGPARPGIAPRR